MTNISAANRKLFQGIGIWNILSLRSLSGMARGGLSARQANKGNMPIFNYDIDLVNVMVSLNKFETGFRGFKSGTPLE